jgi:hypothetical protein
MMVERLLSGEKAEKRAKSGALRDSLPQSRHTTFCRARVPAQLLDGFNSVAAQYGLRHNSIWCRAGAYRHDRSAEASNG